MFYPTESEGPPVQRWQLSLPVVEQAPPTRGNGRLVVISHGSPSNPWVNADLAIALTRAGFIVAAPWHLRDNSSDSSDAGPTSWKRRPHEVSAAIEAVLADARFALPAIPVMNLVLPKPTSTALTIGSIENHLSGLKSGQLRRLRPHRPR